jgi:hypothetical protein
VCVGVCDLEVVQEFCLGQILVPELLAPVACSSAHCCPLQSRASLMFKYTSRQLINRIRHNGGRGNGGSKRTYFSRENIPTISLVIGSCALLFQTMVLFPWHQVLSEQFNTMERNMTKMEDISKQLNQQMDELITLEMQIKKKNEIVLNASQKILSELHETEEHIHSIKKEYIDLDIDLEE